MLRNKMVRSFAAVPLVAFTLLAQGWLDKNYIIWTAKEVDQALNDSPWVKLSPIGLQRENNYESLIVTGQYANWPLNYRIRLLTAWPVREAFLVRLTLSADILNDPAKAKAVKAGDLTPEAESRQRHIEAFIAFNSNDIRVKGDHDNIVVAITVTKFVQSSVLAQYEVSKGNPQAATTIETHERQEGPRPGLSDWMEEPRPPNLLQIRFPDLAPKTFLYTNSGKKVQLSRYDPPGMDMLGAKFYFPRKLPNGSSLITAEDKELRFETLLDGKQVKVKFDLKKMMYKGKLEF